MPDERQRAPVVLVCEEAHRYVPDRGEAEYAVTQAAIRRIAREGRKYGIGFMLVSQSPGEGAALPARIRVRDLEPSRFPRSETAKFLLGWTSEGLSEAQIQSIPERMSGLDADEDVEAVVAATAEYVDADSR